MKYNQTTLSSRSSGFSLIEITVAILIVATLSAVAFTVYGNTRSAALTTLCASRMRSIGQGMLFYAAENNGRLPDTTHTASADRAWIYQLEPFLSDFETVRICPADPQADIRLRNGASSYILNDLVFVPPLDAFGQPAGDAYNRIHALPDPARTVLVFTASDRTGLQPGDDHTHAAQWRSWAALTRDIAPDRHHHRPSEDSTDGRANYLHADGSVITIHAHELKEKLERGINIAEIPGIHR